MQGERNEPAGNTMVGNICVGGGVSLRIGRPTRARRARERLRGALRVLRGKQIAADMNKAPRPWGGGPSYISYDDVDLAVDTRFRTLTNCFVDDMRSTIVFQGGKPLLRTDEFGVVTWLRSS